MELKDLADWRWIRTMSIWAGIVAAVYLVYPVGWGVYWDIYTPEIGLAAISAENTKQIEQLVASNAEREEQQQQQYEDIDRKLKELGFLFGLAAISDAGQEESWAAINISSPAVRLKQGQELRVINTTDGERSITTRVNGTFKAGREYLIRLSAEAGREIEASRNEIQVTIEPVEPEEGRAD